MSINPLRKFLPAALPALLLLPAGPAHESHEPAPTGRLLCVDLGDKAACFAPGTPPEYVEEWLRRLPTYSGDRGKENFNKAARWTVTALQTSTGPQGNPAIVTWGLLPDGVNIPSGVGRRRGRACCTRCSTPTFPRPPGRPRSGRR